MASPRKKSPAALAAVPGVVGGARDRGSKRPDIYRRGMIETRDVECCGSDGDDLPELATLLGGRSRSTAATAASRATGERRWVESPAKKKAVRTRTSHSQTKVSRNGSKAVSSKDMGSAPKSQSTATPSSLVLRAIPSLQLTETTYLPPPRQAAAVPQSLEATTTTTTTTTARSSRQTMQRRSSPRKQSVIGPSPVKRNTVASPEKNKKKEEAKYVESEMRGLANTSSGNSRTSSGNRGEPLKLARVNSLLLPLGNLALESEAGKNGDEDDIFQTKHPPGKPRLVQQKRSLSYDTRRAATPTSAMFVLKEATCGDDGDDDEENDDDDGEQSTDLSGFIVDDDADISFHGSGTDTTGSELASQSSGKKKSRVSRTLVRGSGIAQNRRQGPSRDLSDELRDLSLEDDDVGRSEKLESGPEGLAGEFRGMVLSDGDRSGRGEVEVVDLTSSPVKPPIAPVSRPDNNMMMKSQRRQQPSNQQQKPCRQKDGSPASNSDSTEDYREAVLRFSSPSRWSPSKTDRKKQTVPLGETQNAQQNFNTITTPPRTPPASPSKLRSPSKLNPPRKDLLLSPSKRGIQIPPSPHRQSMDAFWSSEVINEWNDQYSPTKPPLTVSPKKRWQIWADENDSGSESPCDSPARRIASPPKAGGSPSKRALAGEKKGAAAAKKKFDEEKVGLAQSFLTELDERVSDGKLAQLSQGTGGVKIFWSKNLRSTAGRASWRRTVTKASTGSPIKGASGRTGDARVLHYASIELAEKVIDSEERLVNTLAHEYCHLANFMVSGIRDQPHGASFKQW